MREIKYRVWDKKLRSWDKHICFAQDGMPIDIDGYDWQNLEDEKDNYIFQYFTGLKDVAGADLYEGDVIEFTITTPLGLRYDDEFEEWQRQGSKPQIIYWEVKWVRFGFDLGSNGWYSDKNSWRVVGNIFENPELLT